MSILNMKVCVCVCVCVYVCVCVCVLECWRGKEYGGDEKIIKEGNGKRKEGRRKGERDGWRHERNEERKYEIIPIYLFLILYHYRTSWRCSKAVSYTEIESVVFSYIRYTHKARMVRLMHVYFFFLSLRFFVRLL